MKVARIALCAVVLAACGTTTEKAPPNNSVPAYPSASELPSPPWIDPLPSVGPWPNTVVLRVEGKGRAQTISYGVGGTATTLHNVPLPWSATANPTTSQPGTTNTVSLTLQAQGDAGPLTCRITQGSGMEPKLLADKTSDVSVLCLANTTW